MPAYYTLSVAPLAVNEHNRVTVSFQGVPPECPPGPGASYT